MNAAVPIASRRELLRRATFEAHRSLDALASTLDLGRAADFARFLLANAGPLIACETALETADAVSLLPDWPSRVRRHAISHDLAALGLSARTTGSIRVDSLSAQLGMLYVLEGSRFGAQVILKNLERSQDARVRDALRFLTSGSASHWCSFLRVLENATDVNPDELIRSACATFALFHESFAEHVPTRS